MTSQSHSSSAANIVGIHYRVGRKIGEGSFGVIFEGLSPSFFLPLSFTHRPVLGTNLLNSQTVAIKFVGPSPHHREPHFTIHRNPERLKHHSSETNVVPIVSWPVAVSPFPSLPLSFIQGPSAAGIPQIYHFGQEGLHNILVIDLLGPSLEDLFDMCGRKFSVKAVCMAARQMVRADF